MNEHKYSTFWPRFFAALIDTLIFIPVGSIYSYAFSHSTSVPLLILACVVNSSALLLYQIWMHGRFGQTLGKMVCKVVVLDVLERPLSMRQAVLRDIFSVILLPVGLLIDIPLVIQGVNVSVSTNPTTMDWVLGYSASIWLVVEIVSMLTNKKRRAVHDFIAGSVVIRKPRTSILAAD